MCKKRFLFISIYIVVDTRLLVVSIYQVVFIYYLSTVSKINGETQCKKKYMLLKTKMTKYSVGEIYRIKV